MDRSSLGSRVRVWVIRNLGLVTLGLFITAFLLTIIGSLLPAGAPSDPVDRGLDALYRGIIAFAFNATFDDLNLPLQIGRLLAALTMSVAILALLISRLRELRDRLRIGSMKNHIVVCGLGEYGLRAAHACRSEAGADVVCIEIDPRSKRIAEARRGGLRVLTGDASDAEVLLAARIHKAAKLLVLTGDDVLSCRIARVAQEAAGRLPGSRLECHAHIGDPALYAIMQELSIRSLGTGVMRFHPLNDDVIAAHEAIHLLEGALLADASGELRVMVAGTDGFAEALIVELGERRRTLGLPRATVHMVGRGATMRAQDLHHHHVDLDGAVDLRATDIGLTGGEFDWVRDFTASNGCPDVAVVALETEQATVGTSLTLASAFGPRVPVLACTIGPSDLLQMVEAIAQGDMDRPSLQVLDRLSTMSQYSQLTASLRDRLAQAVHANWLYREGLRPDGPETPSSCVPWAELPEELRESNRGQVDVMFDRLRRCGLTIVPAALARTPAATFSEEQVEVLAAEEHERWWKEKEAAGWVYGLATDPKANPRTHADMKPFRDFDERTKDKDRDPIRDIPRIMAIAGFRVVQIDKVAASACDSDTAG